MEVDPAERKDFRDIEDQFDQDVQEQCQKRRTLNFGPRKRIIELRFGEYGGPNRQPIKTIMQISR